MKYTIVIPCYNCENHINRLIEEIPDDVISAVDEVVIIDNKSEDETVLSAKQAIQKRGSDKFKLLVNSVNYGLGGTFKVGFSYCESNGSDYIIFLHGDNQADPNDILTAIEKIKKNPDSVALLGSRFGLKSKRLNYSLKRTLGNLALNLACSLATFKIISDIGSGLNVFNVKRISSAFINSLPTHIAYDMELLLYLIDKFSNEIHFFPITWRQDGQKSNAQDFSVGWAVLKEIALWRVGKKSRQNKSEHLQLSFDRIV